MCAAGPHAIRDGDRTIVVVDDDEALLHALTFSLVAEGYRVLPYTRAEAVLDLPEVPQAACLVVDHRLPKLDGLYLIEMMRAGGLSAPAILMTSHPGPALRARCDSLQIPIVEKPLLRDEISRAIRSAVGA
jgi:two-component system, LuxR family, response regulator FixJ